MTEPTTVNVGLVVANTGDLPGTWATAALNPDFVVLDGYQGGVQTISVSSGTTTLSAPAGFTPTPGPGPTQAQNAVLRFTGAQTGNVTIALPIPGYYIVENYCTGNIGYLLIMASGITAGEYIVIDRGMRQHIYYDGANVRFVNLGVVGQMELWAGYSAIPAWVSTCALPPYLPCDGSVYSYSSYPVLANRLGGTFGGNGVTTFGVPDLRGRVPLAYDGTGSRITAAVSGITGTSIGSAADNQGVTLSVTQLPNGLQCSGNNNIVVYPSANTGLYAAVSNGSIIPYAIYPGPVSGSPITVAYANNTNWSGVSSFSYNNNITVTSSNTGNQPHSNVQPAQVVGIWVIRAA